MLSGSNISPLFSSSFPQFILILVFPHILASAVTSLAPHSSAELLIAMLITSVSVLHGELRAALRSLWLAFNTVIWQLHCTQTPLTSQFSGFLSSRPLGVTSMLYKSHMFLSARRILMAVSRRHERRVLLGRDGRLCCCQWNDQLTWLVLIGCITQIIALK